MTAQREVECCTKSRRSPTHTNQLTFWMRARLLMKAFPTGGKELGKVWSQVERHWERLGHRWKGIGKGLVTRGKALGKVWSQVERHQERSLRHHWHKWMRIRIGHTRRIEEFLREHCFHIDGRVAFTPVEKTERFGISHTLRIPNRSWVRKSRMKVRHVDHVVVYLHAYLLPRLSWAIRQISPPLPLAASAHCNSRGRLSGPAQLLGHSLQSLRTAFAVHVLVLEEG